MKINKIKFHDEIARWPSGAVRIGRMKGSARIRGIYFESYVYFFPSGKVQSGKLCEDERIDGIRFSGGQYVDFDENGKAVAGRTADDQTIGRREVPDGSYIRMASNGEFRIVDITPLYREHTSSVSGVRYSCSLYADGFAGGNMPDSRFAEWGISCTHREFAQGMHQDFMREFMPDELPAFLDAVHRILEAQSAVPVHVFVHGC